MSRSRTATLRPSPIWNARSQTVAGSSTAISSASGQTSIGGPSQPPRANQPEMVLDGSQLARVIVRIAGLGTGPWLLALDRTCWKFGRHDITILMLAIIRNGIAIPVMWDVLGRAGTSTTAQRSALLSRFCAVFGEAARDRHRRIDCRSEVHRHGL